MKMLTDEEISDYVRHIHEQLEDVLNVSNCIVGYGWDWEEDEEFNNHLYETFKYFQGVRDCHNVFDLMQRRLFNLVNELGILLIKSINTTANTEYKYILNGVTNIINDISKLQTYRHTGRLE